MLMWLSCVAEYIAVDFLKINSCVVTKISFALILFFPMFPFDPPENIRKPWVFWRFQGDQKGTMGRKVLNIFSVVLVLSNLKSQQWSS